jgi:hypothetical protein
VALGAGALWGSKVVRGAFQNLPSNSLKTPLAQNIQGRGARGPLVTPDAALLLESAGIVEAGTLRQAPYQPRVMQALLEHIHGEGAVEHHTLARLGDPNARLAGGRHPLTGVPFDLRGFPLFEKYVIFETRIGREFFKGSRADHMREATRHLRAAIDRGEISRNFFTQEQLAQINASRPKIESFSWHHHQELGRMQLLPEKAHKKTGHIGGMEKWKN